MMKMKRFVIAMMGLLMVLNMAACSKTSNPTPQQAQNTALNISAAASLKDAMDEIKANYIKENPNVTINCNYSASGTLEQQIEQGADVDLFMSAATKQVDQLKAKGLTMDDTTKNLLGNQLVLVVPSDSKLDLHDFQDVANADIKHLALGEPKSVPAGQYAEQVFTKLNILDNIKSKIVYGKDVKEVLSWVQTGNADAGVVYATDAKTTDKVKVIATAADNTHDAIVYPATVIKTSKNADSAKAFLNYLSSDKARSVFEKYGFTFMAK